MQNALLLILLGFCVQVNGQISISNLSSERPETKILYLSVENLMEIDGTGSNSLEIRTVKSDVIRYIDEPFRFSLIPHYEKNDTISIWQNGKLIVQEAYEIVPVGAYKCRIGKIKSETATVNEILAEPGLEVHSFGSDWKVNSKVISFETVVIAKGDSILLVEPVIDGTVDTIFITDPVTLAQTYKIGSIRERGNATYSHKLSSYQISEIKKMQRGDKLWVRDIRVSGSDHSTMILEDVILEIE